MSTWHQSNRNSSDISRLFMRLLGQSQYTMLVAASEMTIMLSQNGDISGEIGGLGPKIGRRKADNEGGVI